MEVVVRRAALTVFDENLDHPVISDEDIIFDENIFSYINKNLKDIIKKDGQSSAMLTPEVFCNKSFYELQENDFAFDDLRKDISVEYFDEFRENGLVVTYDLLFLLFRVDQKSYFVIFKLDHKKAMTHKVKSEDEGVRGDLVIYQTMLPYGNSKISEYICFELGTDVLKFSEKKYPVEGNRINIVSERIFNAKVKKTEVEKIKEIKTLVKKVAKKHIEEDPIIETRALEVYNHQILSEDIIKTDEIAEQMFFDNEVAKDELKKEFSIKGLNNQTIKTDTVKKNTDVKKVTIVTDNGFEIKLPYNYDQSNINYVTEEDGSISILIKNVSNLKSR